MDDCQVAREKLTGVDANSTGLLPPGLEFDPCDPFVLLWYSLVNIVITSVVPVPLAGPMTGVAAVLFGLPWGMTINTLTSVVGGYLGLLATRNLCRPCFIKCLGRRRKHWEALDAAILEQGWQIALLIRIAPVSPMVGTNILLSLTSVSVPTYLWTCAIGIVPSNLPYAYAAVIGVELASEFPPRDPVMLTVTVVGLVASIAIAWKVGLIATRLLKNAGVGGDASKGGNEPDVAMPAAAEGGTPTHQDAAEAAADAAAAEAAAEARKRRQYSAAASDGAGSASEGGDVEMQQQPPLRPMDESDGADGGSGAPAAASGHGRVHASGGRKKKGCGPFKGTRAFTALHEDDGL